jgi:hypothetical protein
VNIWEKLSQPAHWNSGYSATGPAASGHQTKSGLRQPGYAPSTSAPERVRPGTHSQQLFHLRAGPCFRQTVAVLQCHVAIEGCPTFPLAWHHEKHSIVSTVHSHITTALLVELRQRHQGSPCLLYAVVADAGSSSSWGSRHRDPQHSFCRRVPSSCWTKPSSSSEACSKPPMPLLCAAAESHAKMSMAAIPM